MIDISNIYRVDSKDRVFVDTNILIFLFSPSYVKTNTDQVERYSMVFSILIQKKCALYVNSHVISEFINRCLRIDFENNFNINKDKHYKSDYRGSMEYEKTIKIVLKQLKKILKSINHINDDFESFDISQAYESTRENDFNDLIIADTVKRNNLKLLSDDKDFRNIGINIDWYLFKE